jgi:AraC-like DNA-binding protein
VRPFFPPTDGEPTLGRLHTIVERGTIPSPRAADCPRVTLPQTLAFGTRSTNDRSSALSRSGVTRASSTPRASNDAAMVDPMTPHRSHPTGPRRPDRSELRIVFWTPKGQSQEQSLRRSIGDCLRATYCRTEHELWEELAHASTRVFILELGLAERPTAANLVELVRTRYPPIRIVGVGCLTPLLAIETLVCAKVGLDALALHGYSDLGMSIRRILVEDSGYHDAVFYDVAAWLPSGLVPLVRQSLYRLSEAPNLTQVARAIGQSSRTLQRAAARETCCAPSDIICAVRVLAAVRLLAHDRRAMAAVLAETGYSSTRALRLAMQRCGLDAPNHYRDEEGYAAARDVVLRFISLRYRDSVSVPQTDPGFRLRVAPSLGASASANSKARNAAGGAH